MNRSARRVLLRLFLLALPLVVLTFVAVSLLSSNVDSLHSHNALTFASKGKRYLSRTSWLDSSYSLSSLTRRVFMELVDSFPLLVGFSSNLDSSSEHAHSQSRWTPRLAQVVLIPKRNRMIFKVDVGCVPLFLLLFSSYVPSHRTFFFPLFISLGGVPPELNFISDHLVIQPCGSQLPLEIVAPTAPSPSSLPHEELKRQLKQLKQVISQLEDRLRLQGICQSRIFLCLPHQKENFSF